MVRQTLGDEFGCLCEAPDCGEDCRLVVYSFDLQGDVAVAEGSGFCLRHFSQVAQDLILHILDDAPTVSHITIRRGP